MSRASRVPYHQNVYDLLGIEPGECPEAARMIAEHEAKHGPLPASVREWYLVPNAMPLHSGREVEEWDVKRGTIWFEYSNIDNPVALEALLSDFSRVRTGFGGVPRWRTHIPPEFARVISGHQGYLHWYVRVSDSDDPSVWADRDGTAWKEVAAHFSGFLSGWLAYCYASDVLRTPCSRHRNYGDGFSLASGPPFEKKYTNGLWLRAPSEPFQPPVIDFLIDRFGEPEVTPRPGNVCTYTWRPTGGTVRVTADEPTLAGGLSAWWVHADTPERLAEFARLLLPWGTLRDTLRADAEPGRNLLNRARGG